MWCDSERCVAMLCRAVQRGAVQYGEMHRLQIENSVLMVLKIVNIREFYTFF